MEFTGKRFVELHRLSRNYGECFTVFIIQTLILRRFRSGSVIGKAPAQMLKEMLTTDPIMQAVALDAVIRHGINKVLEYGAFRDNEEAELKNLLDLRLALLDPEWGKIKQFMSGILH